MYKYEEKINEVGGIDNLSKGIKSLIRDFKKAEKHYIQAIRIRDSLPTKQGHKPKYQNNLGFLYLNIGLYDEAEVNITSSLNRFNEL